MNMKNIQTVIKVLGYSLLFLFSFNIFADTKVIGLIINKSSMDDLNRLYKTEKSGDLGYRIDISQVPLKGIRQAGVVVYENKVKAVNFKFNNSRYRYLNDLLKSKYQLVSEEGEYPNSIISTFENDGDMIFLKNNGGAELDLLYVNKDYNILVNESVKKEIEKERARDLNNL